MYRSLLTIRRDRIVPHLDAAKSIGAKAIGASAVIAQWRLGDATLTIATNLGDQPCAIDTPHGDVIFGKPPGDDQTVPGFTTLAYLEHTGG